MSKRTMTVYEGMEEVKRLKELMTKNILKKEFITCYQGKDSNNINGMTKDEMKSKLQGNLTSVRALLSNYHELKSKIAQSNAITEVSIGNKTYTVAEAIMRKSTIEFEEHFLNKLKYDYTTITGEVSSLNGSIDRELNNYLEVVLGGTRKETNPKTIELYTESFYKSRVHIIFDPNNLSTYIEEMERELNEFISKVNFALVASNAKTEITVEFKD